MRCIFWFYLLVSCSGCMLHSSKMRISSRKHYTTKSHKPKQLPSTKISSVSPKTLQRLNTKKTQSRLAKAAARTVGKKRLRVGRYRYRSDCSGTVRAIYAQAGVPLGGKSRFHGENDVSVLYRYVERHGALHRSTPVPGDLVFFHATYDRSGNGYFDDPLTHVGIIEKVLKDKTIVFIHRINKCIVRSRMNLQMPRLRRDPKTGKPLNHVLRRDSRTGESATSAQLFACFGRVKI